VGLSLEPIAGLKSHRVLADIPRTLDPEELYEALTSAPGWDYKDPDTAEVYHSRDLALLALIYIGALRISEALRLRKSQFTYLKKRRAWVIRGVKLSKEKTRRKLKDGRVVDRPRIHSFREEVFLPTVGRRKAFTRLIMDWVDGCDSGLIFGPQQGTHGFATPERALQICQVNLGVWLHYLRAQGERYLYSQWKDLIQTANYLQVDPRTLAKYLGTTPEGLRVV
jgi:integrase